MREDGQATRPVHAYVSCKTSSWEQQVRTKDGRRPARSRMREEQRRRRHAYGAWGTVVRAPNNREPLRVDEGPNDRVRGETAGRS